MAEPLTPPRPSNTSPYVISDEKLAQIREQNALFIPPDLEPLPASVTRLVSPTTGAHVFIIGTAHVSLESVKETRALIRQACPHQVFLELCSGRRALLEPHLAMLSQRIDRLLTATPGASPGDTIRLLREEEDAADARMLLKQNKTQKDETTETDELDNEKANAEQSWWKFISSSFKAVKTGGSSQFFSILLGSLYKRVESQLKVDAGGEMRAGAIEAILTRSQIVLGDRPIGITLKRTWAAMSLWQKTKLIAGFIQAAFTKLTPEDIEKLKSGGLMSELIQEMSRVYPSLAKHILHERDLYLTSTLRVCPGPVVVAVVGAAHVNGIKAHWDKEINREELCIMPPQTSWAAVLVPVTAFFVVPVIFAWWWLRW